MSYAYAYSLHETIYPAASAERRQPPSPLERLNEGLDGKLTLISAPAGFGKTTLVSAWLARCQRLAAWLSLDEGESDPARFLTYLVAALQTIAPAIGAGIVDALQSPQPPPLDSIVTTLLNDITAISDEFILVLDDYHLLDSRAVDQALPLSSSICLHTCTWSSPPVRIQRCRLIQ